MSSGFKINWVEGAKIAQRKKFSSYTSKGIRILYDKVLIKSYHITEQNLLVKINQNKSHEIEKHSKHFTNEVLDNHKLYPKNKGDHEDVNRRFINELYTGNPDHERNKEGLENDDPFDSVKMKFFIRSRKRRISRFENKQEAKKISDLYLSPSHETNRSKSYRPEIGYIKCAPYSIKLRAPYCNIISSDRDDFITSNNVSDNGVSSIKTMYSLSINLPQPRLIKILGEKLQKLWPRDMIDRYIPIWLFDRRFDMIAGSTKICDSLFNSIDFKASIPWLPKGFERIIEDRKNFENGRYVRCLGIINRLYMLNRIKIKLIDQRKNLHKQNENLLRWINNALIELSNWQDTMLGVCCWIDRTGRISDRKLFRDFTGISGRYKTGYGNFDEGWHWIIHEGELYDFGCLLQHCPIWTGVSREIHKSRKWKSSDTAAGSVKNMAGTTLIDDSYSCAIMSILVHGLTQPNKKRTVINTIINQMKSFIIIPHALNTNSVIQNDWRDPYSSCSTSTSSKRNKKYDRIKNDYHVPIWCTHKNVSSRVMMKRLNIMNRRFNSKGKNGKRKGNVTTSSLLYSHNAYRVQDALMRMVGVSIMGKYKDNQGVDFFIPDVHTRIHIYNFLQSDYPSIDDFCSWLNLSLPLDKTNRYKKQKSQDEKINNINNVGVVSSSIRCSFIVYVLREHYIFMVKNNPAYWKILKEKYRWLSIASKISHAMNIFRINIDKFMKDYTFHHRSCYSKMSSSGNRTALFCCQYSKRWKFIKDNFSEDLINIYERWPILMAIDWICQWKQDECLDENIHSLLEENDKIATVPVDSVSLSISKSTDSSDDDQLQQTFENNHYNFVTMTRLSSFSSSLGTEVKTTKKSGVPVIKILHKKLLEDCWKPLMGTFYRSVMSAFSRIDLCFRTTNKINQYYNIKKSIESFTFPPSSSSKPFNDFTINDNDNVASISKKAKKQYDRHKSLYVINRQKSIKKFMKYVIDKIPPSRIEIGLEWLCTFLYVNYSSVNLMNKARFDFYEKCDRKSAFYALMRILCTQSQDYFILRDFYDMVMKHTTIKISNLSLQTTLDQIASFKAMSLALIDYRVSKFQNDYKIINSSSDCDDHKHTQDQDLIQQQHRRKKEMLFRYINRYFRGGEFKNDENGNVSPYDRYNNIHRKMLKDYSKFIICLVHGKINSICLGCDGYGKNNIMSSRSSINNYNASTSGGSGSSINSSSSSSRNSGRSAKKFRNGRKDYNGRISLPSYCCNISLTNLYNRNVNASITSETCKFISKQWISPFGNNGVALDISDLQPYCSLGGKRMNKKSISATINRLNSLKELLGFDYSLLKNNEISNVIDNPQNIENRECSKNHNIRVSLLGKVVQLYDKIFLMCSYCNNIIQYRWERMTNCDVQLWCGQCIRGKRLICRSRGYIWNEDTLSPTTCTRPISMANVPNIGQKGRCVFCVKATCSPETITYILVWNDIDPRGYANFCYTGVCSRHVRSYFGESWRCTSLRFLMYLIHNHVKSVIKSFNVRDFITGKMIDIKTIKSTRPKKGVDTDQLSHYHNFHYTPERVFMATLKNCGNGSSKGRKGGFFFNGSVNRGQNKSNASGHSNILSSGRDRNKRFGKRSYIIGNHYIKKLREAQYSRNKLSDIIDQEYLNKLDSSIKRELSIITTKNVDNVVEDDNFCSISPIEKGSDVIIVNDIKEINKIIKETSKNIKSLDLHEISKKHKHDKKIKKLKESENNDINEDYEEENYDDENVLIHWSSSSDDDDDDDDDDNEKSNQNNTSTSSSIQVNNIKKNNINRLSKKFQSSSASSSLSDVISIKEIDDMVEFISPMSLIQKEKLSFIRSIEPIDLTDISKYEYIEKTINDLSTSQTSTRENIKYHKKEHPKNKKSLLDLMNEYLINMKAEKCNIDACNKQKIRKLIIQYNKKNNCTNFNDNDEDKNDLICDDHSFVIKPPKQKKLKTENNAHQKYQKYLHIIKKYTNK